MAQEISKHFCACPNTGCASHPINHAEGCDPCIKKNLELGEIPACFWGNVSNVSGTTEYSAENFAKFVMEKNS